MLMENLILLRKINGYSQEEIADKIGISRQAYSKWEKGDTIPDIEKCAKLAEVYGTTIDSLLNEKAHQEGMIIPPGPKGKHIYGSVTVNERGQIAIPKAARQMLEVSAGSRLIVLGDEGEGIALVKAEVFEEKMRYAMEASHKEL